MKPANTHLPSRYMFTTASIQEVQKKSLTKFLVSSLMEAELRKRWSKVSLTLLSICTGSVVNRISLPGLLISVSCVFVPPVRICTVTVSPVWVAKEP